MIEAQTIEFRKLKFTSEASESQQLERRNSCDVVNFSKIKGICEM